MRETDDRNRVSRNLLPRRATTAIEAALADTRVVLVNGARQAGKSTLVRQVAGQCTADWRDLDRPRGSAGRSRGGFVDSEAPLIIDEIQRVPELLLSIKVAVDSDPRPGRFLLTGSRLLGLRDLPDPPPPTGTFTVSSAHRDGRRRCATGRH
ncbi:AAA family ATPase [Nocardia vermiculata]|uniref:AAA family ATPase n=1 Tax=Nocardia vermiculata TaxID=257274 RepID=A0A846Y0F0_9NOCA|nr:AAA family ATPase [Nocardia vermiculata]